MDEPSDNDDLAGLRAALAQGDEAAFAELFDRYGAQLFRTALSIVGRRPEAEDAVQEVFLALARSRTRLADVQDLPAYLFASLRRAAIRQSQRRGPVQALADETQIAGPEPRAEDPRAHSLQRALASLPLEQRQVIAMKIEGELSFAEIGRVLGVSPHTAASRYRYALERLRDRMQP